MGVEKTLLSKMLVPGTHRRVYAIDRHVGLSMAGLVADGRQLVNRAREEALNYKKNYGCSIPPHLLAERMGQFVHYYTLYGSIRPFGTAIMLAGYDRDTGKSSLYMVEPSGVTYVRYGRCKAAPDRQRGCLGIDLLTSVASRADGCRATAVVHWARASSRPRQRLRSTSCLT